MARVTIVFPIHKSSNFADFVNILHSHQEECYEIVQISVRRSRIVWFGLKPILIEGETAVVRHVLQYILQRPIWSVIRRDTDDSAEKKLMEKEAFLNKLCYSREIRVPNPNAQFANNASIYLWIQPPQETFMEYYWTGLLIRWENQLIRALSLTGYYSTLGGGFFLCHHFQSAIALARQQQRLARFCSNDIMYYGCIINQVYSFIYSGKFSFARRLLRQVYVQIAKATPKPSGTLINMYQSAKLFCKRVRQSNLTTSEVDTCKNVTKTIDNNQRIRIVLHDQSKTEDLIAPFRRRG